VFVHFVEEVELVLNLALVVVVQLLVHVIAPDIESVPAVLEHE